MDSHRLSHTIKATLSDTSHMSIERITVLGSGVMGHGIAQISAASGYKVVLRDIKQEFLDRAMEKISWSLDKMVSNQKITADQKSDILDRIRPEVDLQNAVSDTQLVIEVVPEILDLKKKVYAELDAVADPSVIFASNTSTLPITEIAASTSRPDRVVGIHFFNPPQLMKLVEIIPGERTSEQVVRITRNYVESMGKEGITCRKDVPGFIVNRLFIPMVHEACYAMEQSGAKLEEVDSAVKFRMGFPMGIFELADFTGIDVIHKATTEMHMRDRAVIRPHPTIQKLFENNNLGQKTGEGFYRYSDDKYERVQLSKEQADGFDPIRIVSCMINNAAWLITNNATDREEVERAARLGLGLKKGMFDTAREIGGQRIRNELNRLVSEDADFYAPDPLLYSI